MSSHGSTFGSGCAVVVLCAATAWAHEGPPYPILVDQELAGATFTIYADPDVGTGTFFIYVEGKPAGASTKLRIGVAPTDGRLGEVLQDAEPAPPGRPYQYLALATFDQRGPWKARLIVETDGTTADLVVPIDVTPPGGTAFDLLYYLIPFVGLGAVWIKAVLKGREHAREAGPDRCGSKPEQRSPRSS